ncbi:MAG: 3,4-dihydroxy-2-butanone-4-phosphate synthase [Hyphomicrobiales bacterium]|nr:3,4-dihydroxy-2-butanone-4-phosphate synthase [Hyphomicrobiales bacterium]
MKLSNWLNSQGKTQSELAELLGVTQGRVSQLAAGGAPSLELAVKIEKLSRGKVRAEDLTGPDGTKEFGMSELDSVESAIAAVERGELIIVVDDDDRENEGDLIACASKITPEQMAFMIRHCCGIVCAPMSEGTARRLKLDPMVAMNDAPLGTAFTITVDYKEGLTTGISAKERCATVHALSNDNVQAADFVRPGHVFPLIAKQGGVLMRSGHTEAAVDIARLAGEPPVGVICELVNDDGTVKRGDQVIEFAREHDLKIISVDDLIAYRQSRERLVEQNGMFDVDTPAGKARGFAYVTPFDPVQHVAIVYGEIGDGVNIPVRLHREDLVEDVFGNRDTLAKVYNVFKAEGQGILVYLREGTAGVPASKLADGDDGEGTASANARLENWRDVGLGAQVLRDLGVSSIRLLASSERHYVGLSGFEIEITDTMLLDG